MKKLIALLLISTNAFATYGGPAVIIDATTQVPAQVTTNHELRVIETAPVPVIVPTPLSVSASTPLPVSGTVSVSNFPATQPVSGTVTANVGTTNGLALDATVSASQPRKLQDGAGNAVSSQASGIQRALDVGVDVLGVQVDPRQIRALTSSDVVSVQGGNATAVKVDGSAVTQPVSAASLPLPSGASTSANQTTGNTSLSSIDGKLTTTLNGLKVDGSAVTQPVSAASLPLPSGASTSANQATGNSTLSTISGQLPVALDGTGNLKTHEQGTANVNVTNSTVAIQGGNSIAVKVDGSAVTQPVSAASLPLPSGASTAANQSAVQGSASGGASASSSVLSGAIYNALAPTLTTGQQASLQLNAAGGLKVDGSAVTQPVSAASLPLPSGASTAANQATGNSTLSTISGQLPVALDGTGNLKTHEQGTANVLIQTGANTIGSISNISGTVSLPTGASTAANQTTGNTSLSSIDGKLTTTVNGLKVDGSAVTQPVSAASLPLPSGASTSAKQPALGVAGTPSSDVITIQGITSMTPLKVDGSAVTQPVSAASLPLPSGASTSANQTTGNASLSSIAANTGHSPVNANATLSPRQTVTTTETSLAAPANAVGVVVECESTNSDSLRWGFSNSSVAILSSTLGMLCEAGRDTGELHFGAGTYLHMIALGSVGSDFADVQWILSQ